MKFSDSGLTAVMVFLVALAVGGPAHADRPIVAAASDLQFALEEVAERFEEDTGHAVRLNFGSSGNFRRQIAQGAPFELYLSADEEYVLALEREGRLVDEGVLYAIGRIAVIAPTGDAAEIVSESLTPLRQRLEAGEIRRFAIANPEHAPYGVAAMEALQAADLWDVVQPRLVFGENVSQAARLALSGETQGGIVAYSLARAPRIAARSEHALIPEDQHTPLRQRMALVEGAGETAHRFYQYLQADAARAILEEYGFALPEDED